MKKTETQHPSASDHLLVTYECCILAHNWTELWGILLLSRNCHAGQHQNEGIHHCWIAHRGFWSQTTSTSVVFQQGGHTGAKGRRAAWSEGGTHRKPIKVNCLGQLSQKKCKKSEAADPMAMCGLQEWPARNRSLLHWSELNSCEKAVWDFSQVSVNSDQSLSLRMRSLLPGWFYVQSLTPLSLFSCWLSQTELQATFVQHPTSAFHKLVVAEHLAHWMLQICYFIFICDLFELPSCNPIPQL